MHNTQHERCDHDPRRLRLFRPGNARPRARAPGARARRARLGLPRRLARERPRSEAERLAARVRDERGGARSRGGARLLLPRARASGGARRPCRHRRRRPLGRASADGRLALSRLVRLRASERRLARRLELRDPGALPTGRVADREPRLLCHRRPARARAARGRDRADRSRRRRQVGRLGRGAHAEGVVARDLGARERLAVQGRLAPARARDRAGARLSRLLRPAPAAGEARAARHLLRDRDRATCATRSRRRTPPRPP